MNILEEIIAHKKKEVESRKKEKPLSELESLPLFGSTSFSLKRFLLDTTKTGIIAEFKRKSPSKGIINSEANISLVTETYVRSGASGLSILTDEHFFGGSMDDIITARINDVPILRKDFIIDEYQIIETKAIGADIVLLIAAVLTPQQIKDLSLVAHGLGLEVILEIHDEAELEYINDRIDVIGVNNRNLKTFEVDIEQSVRLNHGIPGHKIKISESGLNDVKDLRYLKSIGYHGFLIGENFMKEKDPGVAFMKFASELNELQP